MGLFDFGFNFSKGGGTSIPMSYELMDHQSKLWKDNTEWFNKKGYSMLRQGLIDADYNPLLAIGATPLSGEMPNATATSGTESFGFNMSPSANKQANTAEKMADSQISVNNAQANKLSEEALSQLNYRNNLDSQSALNNIQAIWENESLPYRIKALQTEIELHKYMSANYNANTAKTNEERKYVKDYADAAQTTAKAHERDSLTNATWTPAKVIGGATAGLLTALGVNKLGAGKKFLKKGSKYLGNSGYSSSKAKYFTTLH